MKWQVVKKLLNCPKHNFKILTSTYDSFPYLVIGHSWTVIFSTNLTRVNISTQLTRSFNQTIFEHNFIAELENIIKSPSRVELVSDQLSKTYGLISRSFITRTKSSVGISLYYSVGVGFHKNWNQLSRDRLATI